MKNIGSIKLRNHRKRIHNFVTVAHIDNTIIVFFNYKQKENKLVSIYFFMWNVFFLYLKKMQFFDHTYIYCYVYMNIILLGKMLSGLDKWNGNNR